MKTVQPFIEKLKRKGASRNESAARAAAAKVIRKWNDPILREKCRRIELGEDIAAVVETMRQALQASKNGVGLAAPQIGEALRIIIVNVGFTQVVMVNPQILERSEEMETKEEGCLSYPDVFAPVPRHTWIRVYSEHDQTRDGMSQEFSGFDARLIQHVCDHLDGGCKAA